VVTIPSYEGEVRVLATQILGSGIWLRHWDTSEQIVISALRGWVDQLAPLGGSQVPKTSFATVMADIARGQPA
jgi:hypothetical protein